ncbi:DegT/DnrJ/EryC1/StrS family aminotransferase [Kitasatospora sp. NPDC089509]|uniref:DegT/DnrJ/EryC1/StrS family aminotransferase n=1 Tax=Kitasatospora sp. NPDC089509 TaxID=3364079 RepID=UPI0037FDEE15
MTAPDTIALWRPPALDEAGHRQLTDAFTATLSTGRLREGPHTAALEHALARHFTRHAVAVRSGMDALELLLEHYATPGRTVLVPAHAFQAIPALAARLGARPEPAPVDPASLAPLPSLADRTDRPLVLWIHHGGIVAVHARATIAALRRRGATVIEDGAYLLPDDAPGGPGTWGDAATLSFAPTKPLSGTGGAAVLTADTGLADRLRQRRTHSGTEDLWAAGDQLLRYRSASELDALLATAQWHRRPVTAGALAAVADCYTATLTSRRPELLPPGRVPQSTWGRYLVHLPATHPAAPVRARLAEHGIASSVMAPRPWYDYPALTPFRPAAEQPGLRHLLDHTLALPYHPGLTLGHIQRTARVLLHVLDAKETP